MLWRGRRPERRPATWLPRHRWRAQLVRTDWRRLRKQRDSVSLVTYSRSPNSKRRRGWDRGGGPHTPTRRPSREASSPENGLSNLLREFLGRLPSAHLDLDHGSAALPRRQAANSVSAVKDGDDIFVGISLRCLLPPFAAVLSGLTRRGRR